MSRAVHGDVRQKILHAAEERLWHFGFKKTTIDEIAADAGVGKGTVYLYFQSKEEIALAIMTQFKQNGLEEIRAIVHDRRKQPVEKLIETLSQSVVAAQIRCSQSPAAQELVVAVRPQIQAHLQPFLEQEIALIAEVLEEGNQTGIFAVEDTLATAQTLKWMTAGFWPPYPCVEGIEKIREAIHAIVALAFRGLKKSSE